MLDFYLVKCMTNYKIEVGTEFQYNLPLGEILTGKVTLLDSTFHLVEICWDNDPVITREVWSREHLIKAIERGYIILKSSSGCYHEWKKYVGFTDVFDYCDKCGVKRP